MVQKFKTINYSFHISNFLARVVQSQKNLEVKTDYFFTTDILELVKSLTKVGLVAGSAVEPAPTNFKLKLLISNSALSA